MAWAQSAPPRSTWAVALSGGADSLCLLLLLWAHWPERRARLRALHFNHRLRGAESRRDAAFCRRVCAALGVPLVEGEWKDARRGASEAEARAARHAFFGRHARVLWLGHQQDDIAETMFMRIARGSGTGGLAAPRPIQASSGGRLHLRPLMTVRKADVVAVLRRAGARWCEDSSNAADCHFRNRVRRLVLPPWRRAAGRDALAGAARARELLEEDDVALETWLAALRPLRADGALDLRKLAGKPRGLVRRALHRWMLAQARPVQISRQAFDALLAAAMACRPTRHSMGVDSFAVVRPNRLTFEFGRKTGR